MSCGESRQLAPSPYRLPPAAYEDHDFWLSTIGTICQQNVAHMPAGAAGENAFVGSVIASINNPVNRTAVNLPGVTLQLADKDYDTLFQIVDMIGFLNQ